MYLLTHVKKKRLISKHLSYATMRSPTTAAATRKICRNIHGTAWTRITKLINRQEVLGSSKSFSDGQPEVANRKGLRPRALHAWSSLSGHVQSAASPNQFRELLKRHLFRISYPARQWYCAAFSNQLNGVEIILGYITVHYISVNVQATTLRLRENITSRVLWSSYKDQMPLTNFQRAEQKTTF